MVTGAQEHTKKFVKNEICSYSVIKRRGMEWLGHVVRMDGERTAVYGKAKQEGDGRPC